MKIDCHLHLPVRKELLDLNAQKDFLLKELDNKGIDYGIIIPDNQEKSPIGNLQQCLALFQEEKRIFLLGSINVLSQPVSYIAEIERLFKLKKIVGLKIFPGYDKHYPNDARLFPYISLCLKYDAPLVVHTGWNTGDHDAAKWNDPKYMIEIVQKYSGLKILICHYFWPEIEYCYRVTRGYRNIHFDTSGLADKEVERTSGKPNIKHFLDMTIQDNPKSVMFGSDFGMCDIGSHFELVNSLNISAALKEAVFYRNTVNLFHLSLE